MAKVKKLDPQTVRLIAAGEVVERPASVLKELVENSLDADATKIEVNLAEGGKDLIEVIDNGSGMEAADALMALQMHATSKIDQASDLLAISSFGFRGEALASIAAVSELRLDTFDGVNATSIENRGVDGQIVAASRFSLGTQLQIKQLFGNLPARAKFLRSTATELASCQDVFVGLALGRLDVDWSLKHNGRELYRLPAAKNITERVFAIWSDLAKKSYELSWQRGNLEITGLVGNPEAARKDRKQQFILVNGRSVQDRVIQRAISEAFKGFIHRDLQPSYILKIQLPPQEVDVNVHPRKQEVKFADTQAIYGAVMTSIRDLLANQAKQAMAGRLTPDSVVSKGESADTLARSHTIDSEVLQNRTGQVRQNTSTNSYSHSFSSSHRNIKSSVSPFNSSGILKSSQLNYSWGATTEQRETSEIQGTSTYEAAIPWQLWGTYIVYEHQQELVIVDQHAAAEKIRYERLRKDLGHPKSQRLLVPEIIELSAQIHSRALLNVEALQQLGLEIADFGDTSLQISAKPEVIPHLDTAKMLSELFSEREKITYKGAVDDFSDWEQTNPDLHMLIATAACHGSIRAGQLLNVPEMRQVLIDLNKCAFPYNCPHGRPVSFIMSRKELEQNFKRII